MAVETNPRLEAALDYAQRGWPVVPLHTPDDSGACDCHQPDAADADKHAIGKHPRTRNGLKDATTDADAIRRWWLMWPHANIAVDLVRAGLVDIAPDSMEWWAEFTARGLPHTAYFNSGGGDGHVHYLYTRPDWCPAHRITETGKYDILSNGYAVMPPSLHRSGAVYAWQGTGAMAVAPEWAVQVLVERVRKNTRPAQQTTLFDDDAPPVALRGDALERWYGRSYHPRPDGGVDRSESLWRIAIDLLEAGLAAPYVESVLAQRDLALGWEKFTDRGDAAVRYRVITEHAASAASSKRVTLKRLPVPEPALSSAFLTAVQLEAMEDEDVQWYAEGLLGAGLLTELDGKAKQAGKTTFLLALCRAILHGEPFLGKDIHYTPIVYLTEQSGPSFKRNLRRAGLLDRPDLYLLLWSTTAGVKWPEIVEATRAYARSVGAGVLIVDTLSQFAGIRGDAENSSGAALETMEPLQAATADELAILVSRHDRKSGGDVGDSGRGSSAYAGSVDIVLHLQRLAPSDRQDRGRQRLLDGISRFEETPDQLVVELQPEPPQTYTLVGDAKEVRDEVLRVNLLALLPTDAHDAPTFDELRKELGMREIDVRRVLNGLVRDKLVERFDRPYRYRQVVTRWTDD